MANAARCNASRPTRTGWLPRGLLAVLTACSLGFAAPAEAWRGLFRGGGGAGSADRVRDRVHPIRLKAYDTYNRYVTLGRVVKWGGPVGFGLTMFRLIASKAVPFDLPTVGIFALGAAGTYAVGSVMQSVATRWAGELVD